MKEEGVDGGSVVFLVTVGEEGFEFVEGSDPSVIAAEYACGVGYDECVPCDTKVNTSASLIPGASAAAH